MRLKVTFVLVWSILIINAQGVNLNGYYNYNYGLIDSLPASSQFYNPTFTSSVERLKPEVQQAQQTVGLSQYQQIPTATLDTSYTQYLSPPYSSPQRYNHSPLKHYQYQRPEETIVTPVQHSTVIHHTPYLSTQSLPYIGRYIPPVNGKPQVHVQPLTHHPLQKPLHYQQQHPLRFNPSPQIYPHQTQGEFVPIPHPQNQQNQHYNKPPPPPPKSESSESSEDEEQEKESEDLEDENEDSEDVEDKGELNEESDDEDNEDNERYRDEEEAEEEEEERPKYTNYSFHFDSNSPSPQTQSNRNSNNQGKNNQKQKNEEVDDDDNHQREGYRTHEDVEEDDEEDSNEDSSRINFNKHSNSKKTPKNYSKHQKFQKFEKQKPVNKYYQPFHYEPYSFPNPNSYTKPSHSNIPSKSSPKKTNYNKSDMQTKPSKNHPIKTVVREKWFIMKKNT